MDSPVYRARPYSRDAFVDACTSRTVSRRACERNAHTQYFQEYLEAIGCQAIVVEDDYIDRDYLVDFTNYYARCFERYRRKCRRLHFFKTAISDADVKGILDGSSGKSFADMQDDYLGFIVVKPLPLRFFGRTCLRTYPAEKGRQFTCLRDYSVDLAGDRLTVRSLAFQEQDREVAACATSAIWSALHKTAHAFGFHVPTPSEITNLADDGPVGSKRNIPNNGLTVEEIGRAIRHSGLEVEILRAESLDAVRQYMYAYLAADLPVILVHMLRAADGDAIGAHAATAAGYCLDEGGQAPQLYSSRITKLYLHDDQAGPFSRARFTAGNQLETRFPDRRGPVTAQPLPFDPEDPDGGAYTLVVPVYPKMRVSATEVFRYFAKLYDLFATLRLDPDKLEWEIRAISNSDYKQRLAKLEGFHSDKLRIRGRGLPKFLWLISAHREGVIVFDLLLDATGIRDADLLATTMFYGKEEQNRLWNGLFRHAKIQEALHARFDERYVNAMLELFRPTSD
jgi:hypothetical protein